ncbi:MAG: aspartyl protease family protein [Oceanicaulis sp.]
MLGRCVAVIMLVASCAIPAPPLSAAAREPESEQTRRVHASTQSGPLMVLGRVDGRPETRRFILDTGATISALTPGLAQALALDQDPDEAVRVRTLYGVFERGRASRAIPVRLFGEPDMTVSLRPLIFGSRDLHQAWGGRYDGLIGADFLAGRAIELDWADGEPDLYIGEQVSNVDRTEWRPHVTLKINGVTVECLVDTARSSSEGPLISIAAPMTDLMIEGEPTVFTTGARFSDMLIEEFLAPVELVNGEARTAIVQVERLQPGSNLDAANFEGEPHCFLGPPFLQSVIARFAPEGPVSLSWRADPVVAYNRSGFGGLVVDPLSRAFRAAVITENGPAAEAGLREGDVIVAIDGRPLEIATIGYFRDAMHGAPGDAIDIRYERDGEMFETTLVLRDLLR